MLGMLTVKPFRFEDFDPTGGPGPELCAVLCGPTLDRSAKSNHISSKRVCFYWKNRAIWGIIENFPCVRPCKGLFAVRLFYFLCGISHQNFRILFLYARLLFYQNGPVRTAARTDPD